MSRKEFVTKSAENKERLDLARRLDLEVFRVSFLSSSSFQLFSAY